MNFCAPYDLLNNGCQYTVRAFLAGGCDEVDLHGDEFCLETVLNDPALTDAIIVVFRLRGEGTSPRAKLACMYCVPHCQDIQQARAQHGGV